MTWIGTLGSCGTQDRECNEPSRLLPPTHYQSRPILRGLHFWSSLPGPSNPHWRGLSTSRDPGPIAGSSARIMLVWPKVTHDLTLSVVSHHFKVNRRAEPTDFWFDNLVQSVNRCQNVDIRINTLIFC